MNRLDAAEGEVWIPVVEWLKQFPRDMTLEQFDHAPLMKVRLVKDEKIVQQWWMHLGDPRKLEAR